MEKRAPCGCLRVGGGWNVSECECPVRKQSLEVYRRLCPVLVIDGLTGTIISDFHPLRPDVAKGLQTHGEERAGPAPRPSSPALESFDEATTGGSWVAHPPSTVGRETFAELLEELEVSVGKTKPTEAEYVRRTCRVSCQQAGRTWLINARGDVQEVTDKVRELGVRRKHLPAKVGDPAARPSANSSIVGRPHPLETARQEAA